MKFTVRIFTVIPDQTARSYAFMVDADSMDTAQIQLSRKIAHDWVEIPEGTKLVNVRTSYIAATEIEQEEEPARLESAVEILPSEILPSNDGVIVVPPVEKLPVGEVFAHQ